MSSGCPVPPSAFPEAVVRRDLKLFLGAVAAMTAADVPISHDTWSALFRTCRRRGGSFLFSLLF